MFNENNNLSVKKGDSVSCGDYFRNEEYFQAIKEMSELLWKRLL